ncbi:interferon gamma receptor 1 isoform X2 [Tiliqua scincoides]|uniref:interferon gamma receptor 1 isoform X2 n=1 Tax=Tiliqua scincoides TaxID=71010 RepID=UPI003461B79C
MGLVRALVGLALFSWVCCGQPVPPPTNVIIQSYNFNTSLFWDYTSASLEPLFTVRIDCYMGDTKYVVDTCVNISQRYCDLTYKIPSTCTRMFWAYVKAVAGSHGSSYARSGLYELFHHGRIGPPKLHLSLQNAEINVLIEDPLTPYFEDNYPLSVRQNITDLSYLVYMRPNGSSERPEPFEAKEEACGKRSCTISLTVQTPDVVYCISAQGNSEEEIETVFEESKESCIIPWVKHSLDLRGPIIGGSLAAAVLAVILTIVAVCICLKNPNVKLPKSLATVVRSIKPSEIQPESKCKVSIYKPMMPKYEDESLIEHTDPIEELQTTDLTDCGEVNTGDSKRPSSIAGERSIQDGTAVEIPESEHSLEVNDNYSKSVSGQEEPCNMLPSLDVPPADVRQPTNIGRCRNISGYDKPHWRDSNSDGEAALIV